MGDRVHLGMNYHHQSEQSVRHYSYFHRYGSWHVMFEEINNHHRHTYRTVGNLTVEKIDTNYLFFTHVIAPRHLCYTRHKENVNFK